MPTLVEQAPRLRSGGYVIDFWGLGYDVAERMGLTGEADRIGYHVHELRIVDDRGERVTGFGTKVFSELTGGRYVTLGRSELSRLLFEKVRGDVEVVFGDEIASLHEHADGVEVRFAHAGGRRFDLVIGADGLHSNVRRLAFGPQERFERQLGYIVAAFEVRGYRPRDENVYLLYNEPGRMLGRFTLRDDRTLFLLVFAADRLALPGVSDLAVRKAVLRERYGDAKWECPQMLRALEGADELYFDSVSQIRMERWSHGRIALVGDAAFCVSLLAGQGSALAMTAAYVLAGELARSGGRHEEAYGEYERYLRAYVGEKQKAAARFAKAFAPGTHWGLFLRNQVIRTFATPGLAKFTIGRDIFDTLQLPHYRWPELVR